MAILNPIINRTCVSIELGIFVTSYSNMLPRHLSSFILVIFRLVYHICMVSIRSIRIWDNSFGCIRSGGQITNKVSRG